MPPKKKNGEVKPKAKAKGKQKAYQLADLDATGLLFTDIFKKNWRVGAAVGTGGFGRLYQVTDESNNTGSDYVMKIEPKENGPLFTELSFYQRVATKDKVEEFKKSRALKSLGMPVFITKGLYDDKYRFMVIPRYKTDLQKIFIDCNRSFPVKTVITFALQTLDVLEYLHSNKYVHANIKAANLLIGLKDTNQIYLVDYGLATMYKSSEGEHCPYKPDPKKAHDGTIEFTSRDAHDGCAPSRRGDLEILGYCCLQWLNSQLPWETCLNQPEKVADQKRKFMEDPARSVFTLSADIPNCLVEYLVYVANLAYDEKPDYSHIRTTFKNGMKKEGIRLDGKLSFTMQAGSPRKRKSTGKTPAPKRQARTKSKAVTKATTKQTAAAKKSAANDQWLKYRKKGPVTRFLSSTLLAPVPDPQKYLDSKSFSTGQEQRSISEDSGFETSGPLPPLQSLVTPDTSTQLKKEASRKNPHKPGKMKTAEPRMQPAKLVGKDKTDVQVEEAVMKWSEELLNKLRSWSWDNGKATTFYSSFLRHKGQQDKLLDLLKWAIGCQNHSSAVQQYISNILEQMMELALRPVPYPLMPQLSTAVHSLKLPLNEEVEVLKLVVKVPHAGQPIDETLEAFVQEKQQNEGSAAPNSATGVDEQKDRASEVSDDQELEERVEVDSIDDILARFLDAKKVPHYQIIYDPNKDHHLNVFGEEVEVHQEELSSMAEEKGCTITTKNKTVELDSHGFPLLSNWIVSCAGVIRDPTFALHSNDRHVVWINAIMQADITRRKRSSEEYFAVTTAHAVLSEEQKEKLNESMREFDDIYDEVGRESLSKEYTMAVRARNPKDSQETEDIDVMPPPQWIYKYFARCGDTSERAALQDIALLNLVGSQVNTAGLVSSGNQNVDPDEQSLMDFQDAYIKRVCSRRAVRALVGQRIICKGKEGVVVESSTTRVEDHQKEGYVMGVHLEFKFNDSNFKLIPGDCGSLVYLVEKVDGKLPIVGMFFGQLLEDKRIHCALILHWNIKLAEKTDKLRLKNIKLATHSPDAECLPPGETERELNDGQSLATENRGDEAGVEHAQESTADGHNSSTTQGDSGVGNTLADGAMPTSTGSQQVN